LAQGTTATTDDADARFRSSTSATRALLACAVVAGPLYEVVFLAQAFTRPGFDVTRHTGSLLSLGDLGWVQIANFVVTGLLLVAGAVGMRRALRGGRGGTWGPMLIGLYGLSFVAAGVFTPDPMDGFPPGTPPGPPAGFSWHAGLHFLAGGVGFLALPAGCLVLARGFAALRQRAWAAWSAATGVLVLVGFAAVGAAAGQRWATVAFVVAVALAWVWLSATAARLLAGLAWPRGA
jgi:hypothetical protein